jgi:histone acetyltransferase (RNA polymerase elongator complex component)
LTFAKTFFSLIKHFTIPVFIPELACPFQCAFCNQRKISGHIAVPGRDEILKIIKSHLETFPDGEKEVEIGFFGGSFTGLPLSEQERFLKIAEPFLERGEIDGIRLSTRPDYINQEVLDLLKKYKVAVIELGAQSFDDEVLKRSYRGHTAAQTEEAARKITNAGFKLGLQMMIGLPDDTLERSLYTARRIAELEASCTRIYPTVVIRDTAMHQWYEKGTYRPLSLEKAVEWTKHLLLFFEKKGVKVIRTGLHPSDGLTSGKGLIAGPFHPSFKELVMTEIWHDMLKDITGDKNEGVRIIVPPAELNFAVGYKRKNKNMLLKKFKEVKFVADNSIIIRGHWCVEKKKGG